MDFTKNVVLKENYTFLVADSEGRATGREHGVYDRDTRYLRRYAWNMPATFHALLVHSPRPNDLVSHHALISNDSQQVAIRRRLVCDSGRLEDVLDIENTGGTHQSVSLELELAADFADLFEVRGWHGIERAPVHLSHRASRASFDYKAADKLRFGVEVELSTAPSRWSDERAVFDLDLAPGEKQRLSATLWLRIPLAQLGGGQDHKHRLLDYDSWRKHVTVKPSGELHQAVLNQAVDDLRALLLATEHGPVPAAGIPWFVAVFGRDALLTAYMMLDSYPEVAAATLRFLASHQGTGHDPWRGEQPGKIMHELRYGELTRTGQLPHSPYFGTVDATALFVMLLHELWSGQNGANGLLHELKDHWEAALAWLTSDADVDGDGFLEFTGAAPDKGLVVQSWKDSHDSLSHRSGELASGAIAVSEVQGYAYAAYCAASAFYQALKDDRRAAKWLRRARNLQASFHERFWLEELGTYALGLDGDKRPLEVHNSNAGQLLWSGIVPEAVAPRLVATLMSDALWSGWGIRTLGMHEARYNPLSYHNGSVWPHDNALIAAGMARYGFRSEALKIRSALFDIAATQLDKRLPELVAGYERTTAPPVPYPVACRPQAWDAAALLYLMRL